MSLLHLVATFGLIVSPDQMATRMHDWRVGPVVYQVFVDRFAPSNNPDAKRALIRPPRIMKSWTDTPKPGKVIKSLGLYSHELEFWGGDLESTRTHLDYVSGLGADVLYLNPIHQAFSNHKYDAEDFTAIDPSYGNFSDFKKLETDIHGLKMKLVLDGVFNHIGKSSPIFESASAEAGSPYRDWFFFDPSYSQGYRGWDGVSNLPALKLENPKVRTYLWNGADSVVRKFLKEGADGWRLDVAFEIGPKFLSEVTSAAHQTKEGSLVVGEVLGYPSGWFPSVDGVLNFFPLALAREMIAGKVSGAQTGLALNQMVSDAGIDNLLKSWLQLDNHDTARISSMVPDIKSRDLLWGLQMTLPGSPVIYYGSELGMQGDGDPQNRAPMRWDLASKQNPNLAWVSKLIRIRRSTPALRYGDFEALDTNKLLAYSRTTDKVLDTCIVVVNPTDSSVRESFPSRVGRLMSYGTMTDVLSGERIRTVNGLLDVTMPAKSICIFRTDSVTSNGYSPYHRIP